jgi:hypothetical protein
LGDDVGARDNLQRWLHLPNLLDYAAVGRTLAGWHPDCRLIYFHLLLDRLTDVGYLRVRAPLLGALRGSRGRVVDVES